MAFMLLNESKRDDLLLPYFELVKGKNHDLSFGQFKSNLLEHLTQNGGLRNLSLASNYYLAGAARYYFNGDLTTNKNLALFYPYTPNSRLEAAVNNGEQIEPNHVDQWNTPICQSLNKIILLLRNAYIDSLGETWEQPEDFGTLPLDKLIKKYNTKIKKIKSDDDDVEKETLDTNPRVSDNYTFEIMYSHEDCQKFYQATSPGAWCITYGQNHYNYYVRDLDIHYVVFKRDGWENVPRIPQKEKWVKNGSYLPKPQDDYGNSLICLLQSNRNGQPVYITSRWNHGSGDSGSLEADHAYTKEEFMKITGVSDEQLKRIFEIWLKTTKTKRKTNADISECFKNLVRKLKEFQIRVNGGADIVEYMEKFGIEYDRSVFHTEEELSSQLIKKSVFVMNTKEDDEEYLFIMDKGKIIFESIFNREKLYKDQFTYIIPTDFENEGARLENSIIIPTANYFMIYNYRMHKFIDIDGVVKFKRVPLPADCNSYKYNKISKTMFYEIKQSKYDIALVNTMTNKPLVLPNGEIWCNEVKTNYGWEPDNKIFAHFVGGLSLPVIEITYDMSSGEKYFYNVLQKKFVEFEEEKNFVPRYMREVDKLVPSLYLKQFGYGSVDSVFGVHYKLNGQYSAYDNSTPYRFYDARTNEPINIFGLENFDDISSCYCEEPIFKLYVKNTLNRYKPTPQMAPKIEFFKKIFPTKEAIVYDMKLKKPLGIAGDVINPYDIRENNNFIFFYLNGNSKFIDMDYQYSMYNVAIYDTNAHQFVKNESGFPSYRYFLFDSLNTYGDYEKDLPIGWYFPSKEVKESDKMVNIDKWTSIKEGSLPLEVNNLTYYPIELNDYYTEYKRLFGNDEEQQSQEIMQEDIRRMVENVINNILKNC